MRLMLCLLTVCFAAPVLGKPAPKKKKKLEKIPAIKRKLLDRQISENAGILGALRSQGSLSDAFGSGGLSVAGQNSKAFKKADALYARGEWVKAQDAYIDAGAEESKGFGPTRANARLGITCQETGDLECALAAAKRDRTAGSRMGMVGLGGGFGMGRSSDPRSRLERALPDLIKLRRKAKAAKTPADARELYGRLLSRDPRCPGERCPPYVLREAAEAHHRDGRHERAAELMTTYLKVLPKANDRKAAKALLKAAKAAEKKAVADEKAALDARQVRLSVAKGKAPWLKLGNNPSYDFKHLRFGGKVGIARLVAGKQSEWLGVTHGERVVGRLALPAEFEWLAVGLDGAIYYVTKAGALYRAASLDAARKRFKRLRTFKDVEHWHLSGTTLVASNDRVVHVSTDGGTRFETHRHDGPISKVWARADGVVAFGDKVGAWISTDGGKTWEMTPLGDMTSLTNDGQRIYQAASDGRGYGMRGRGEPNCAQGELTADRKWVVVDDEYQSGRAHGWDVVFSLGDYARSPRSPANGLGRAAMTKGKDALTEVRACRSDPAAWFKANRGGAGGIGGRGSRCTGLDCLVRPGLPATPVHYGLLGDASCAEKARERAAIIDLVPRTRRRNVSWGRRGATLCGVTDSAGTLMRVDPKGVTRSPVVPDCDLEVIKSAGGLGLGLCQNEGGNALVVLDAKGAARERRPLPGPVEDIALAADGTLLVQVRVDGAHQALVRRPAALGAANAWRSVTVPSAEAWRVATGGQAIAILPGSKGKAVVKTLRSLRDDSKWTSSWRGDDLKGVEACYAKAFATDPTVAGDVTIIASVTKSDGTRQVADVQFENSVKGETGALLACLDAHVRSVRVPYDVKSKMRHGFRLQAELQSYRLVLSTPKGETPLTEDVTFDAAPEQFAVRTDGTIQVTHSTYPKQHCTVSKSGAPLCPREK